MISFMEKGFTNMVTEIVLKGIGKKESEREKGFLKALMEDIKKVLGLMIIFKSDLS